MRVLSVNVGQPAELRDGERTTRSGIVKRPVAGPVMVRAHNLEGDRQADLRVHGGPDKAVYAYDVSHYAHWEMTLGRDDLASGHFGENLTVEGLTEDVVGIGDVFRVGGALLEVSQPRVPCVKLGMRMGDPGFLKVFLESGRSGFYLRVLEEGVVAAGDAVERVRAGEGAMTVEEINRAFVRHDPRAARRAAALPALAPGWRRSFAQVAARPNGS